MENSVPFIIDTWRFNLANFTVAMVSGILAALAIFSHLSYF